jgi:hypothetical protein
VIKLLSKVKANSHGVLDLEGEENAQETELSEVIFSLGFHLGQH